MDDEITRLRHLSKDDSTGKTLLKHFQGRLMLLFLPSLLLSGDFLSSYPNTCICTHILTLRLQAHQPWLRRESETPGCAKEKEKMSWPNLQGMPTLHVSEMFFSSCSHPLDLFSDVFSCTHMLDIRCCQSSHHQPVEYQKRPFLADFITACRLLFYLQQL